jgi:hypothetical protein
MAQTGKTNEQKTKRVPVTFTLTQLKIIGKLTKSGLGKNDPDAVNKIVVSWLIEKNFIKPGGEDGKKEE